MHLQEMTSDACLAFLADNHRGHLACRGAKYPYVVPIHYAYEASELFMFSMPGQKIDNLRENPSACLQVEKLGADRTWTSVVVQGSYDELSDTPSRKEERLHAWSLLQKRELWWEPGSFEAEGAATSALGPVFFRISIEEISGRQLLS